MAKKNMGLDYALIRYHRIGSPTDPRRVLGDRPLECALCHADRSVEELVSTMERWWGKRYDRAALRALYGDDLTVNALRATLALGKPHEQAVAIAVLGQSGDRTAIPAIAAAARPRLPAGPLLRAARARDPDRRTGRDRRRGARRRGPPRRGRLAHSSGSPPVIASTASAHAGPTAQHVLVGTP